MLTPLAIDPAHPFPQLLNKSLNIMVRLEMRAGRRRRSSTWRWCSVPRILPRLVQLPREDDRRDYVFLGHLIGHYLADLFPGTKILGFWPFRVTRNSELYIDEEDTANLLKAVENELHNRRNGDAVRLEIDARLPAADPRSAARNARSHRGGSLSHRRPAESHAADGDLSRATIRRNCATSRFVAPVAPALRGKTDLFAAIRERDVLLHHPYENFRQRGGFSRARRRGSRRARHQA